MNEDLGPDNDLWQLGEGELRLEVLKLRAAIRKHRDADGHDLCWYHPEIWGLLPEHKDNPIGVPPWPEFMCKCAQYRASLDKK